MKSGQSNKQSSDKEEIKEGIAEEAVHPLADERIPDFEHRVRYTYNTEGQDAIIEASDEIIDMLLSQSNRNQFTKEKREVNRLDARVPYLNYGGIMITHLGWAQKVEDYMNTDWEALKHPGDSVGRNMLTGR